jgi:hypothetical protein
MARSVSCWARCSPNASSAAAGTMNVEASLTSWTSRETSFHLFRRFCDIHDFAFEVDNRPLQGEKFTTAHSGGEIEKDQRIKSGFSSSFHNLVPLPGSTTFGPFFVSLGSSTPSIGFLEINCHLTAFSKQPWTTTKAICRTVLDESRWPSVWYFVFWPPRSCKSLIINSICMGPNRSHLAGGAWRKAWTFSHQQTGERISETFINSCVILLAYYRIQFRNG